jgi:hypothetical protein
MNGDERGNATPKAAREVPQHITAITLHGRSGCWREQGVSMIAWALAGVNRKHLARIVRAAPAWSGNAKATSVPIASAAWYSWRPSLRETALDQEALATRLIQVNRLRGTRNPTGRPAGGPNLHVCPTTMTLNRDHLGLTRGSRYVREVGARSYRGLRHQLRASSVRSPS